VPYLFGGGAGAAFALLLLVLLGAAAFVVFVVFAGGSAAFAAGLRPNSALTVSALLLGSALHRLPGAWSWVLRCMLIFVSNKYC
jgi:hypothetical protein